MHNLEIQRLLQERASHLAYSKTSRGFILVEFRDAYGHPCSVQESSIVEPECIWVGIDDPSPRILATRAPLHGVATEETTGWVPYPDIPADVLLTTRMHLTREQAGALANVLNHFADTGSLPTPKGDL